MSSSGSHVFASRTPQRGDATGKLPGCESPCSRDIGPGTYDLLPGVGHPFWQPWHIDPMRQQSSFISKTEKAKTPPPPTQNVDFLGDADVSVIQGSMPASRGLTWTTGERKPPHFHVPFRAYPSNGGEPRGRSKGLDQWYDIDRVCASPLGLHGTLVVNMHRTPRRYASTFQSKQPSRPRPGSGGSAGALGPGSHDIDRSGIKIRDPKRPSPAFRPPDRGRYAGVGGPKGDGGLWPDQYQRPKEAWA